MSAGLKQPFHGYMGPMNYLGGSERAKSAVEIVWPEPPPGWAGNLAASTAIAHVWASKLDVSAGDLAAYAATLSPAEHERAGRFRFELHRDRFIAGRGLMRAILSHYLGIKPAALELRYGAQGKPFLAGKQADSGWHFNLTHAQDLCLLAVASTGAVGVDVEAIRSMPDALELVSRFFSPREVSAFRRLLPAQQPEAFFNLWTRKEAWLKATGEGLGDFLSQVEVSFVPGEPVRVLEVPEGWQTPEDWRLLDLAPAQGFAGALVLEAPTTTPKCWRWPQRR